MRLYILLVWFILLNISVFGQQKNSGLTGEWESVVAKNQRVVLLSFKSDSTLSLTYILTADYKYKLKGDTLISTLHVTNPDKIIIDTSYLVVKPDTVIRCYNRKGWKDTVIMIKTGQNEIDTSIQNNSLVGKWKWEYPAGDTARSTFYNDGRWHFSVPRDKYKGKYTVVGDTIIVNLDGQDNNQKKTFWVKGKLLGIKDINSGIENLFRRVKE